VLELALLSALQRKQTLATPNYGYEKRQRELAKKNKKADKLREKAERKNNPDPLQPLDEGAAPEADSTPPSTAA
jgi:hypothetical protein